MPIAMTTQTAERDRPPADPVGETRRRTIEPALMPISSIESTMPSTARSMPHSAAMPGDAKLIERTSKPSSAVRRDADGDGDDLRAAHRLARDDGARILDPSPRVARTTPRRRSPASRWAWEYRFGVRRPRRNVVTTRVNSSACSTFVRCAAPGSTTSSLSAIAVCSSSDCRSGADSSSSPATMSDGARMRDTTSRRSASRSAAHAAM